MQVVIEEEAWFVLTVETLFLWCLQPVSRTKNVPRDQSSFSSSSYTCKVLEAGFIIEECTNY